MNMQKYGCRQGGFTLLELGIVISVISLLLGVVAIGKDLQRNAVYQRISSDFVQGWLLSYDAFVAGTGIVPGDAAAAPTGLVNANTTELCGNALMNAFMATGIRMPEGRTEGSNNRYVYLDSNGNPQEMEVCFQNVSWAEPGSAVGTYVTRARNVMVLKRVTPALAGLLDSQVDGHPDARFGRLRQDTQANSTLITTGQLWSIDERMAYDSTVATSLNEDQVAVVTAYVVMNR